MSYTFAPVDHDKDELICEFTNFEEAVTYAEEHNCDCIAVLWYDLGLDPSVVDTIIKNADGAWIAVSDQNERRY